MVYRSSRKVKITDNMKTRYYKQKNVNEGDGNYSGYLSLNSCNYCSKNTKYNGYSL